MACCFSGVRELVGGDHFFFMARKECRTGVWVGDDLTDCGNTVAGAVTCGTEAGFGRTD